MSEATNKAMDEFCRLYKSAIVVFSTEVTAANVAEVIDEHITHHMHKRDKEGSS